MKIVVAPGLATMLDLPCEFQESVLGDRDSVNIFQSETNLKRIYVNLKKGNSRPTNLIVVCKERQSPMVFDIVPSLKDHQDYVDLSFYQKSSERDRLIKSSSGDSSAPMYIDLSEPSLIKRGGE